MMKISWQDRVKQTDSYHKMKCSEAASISERWTIRDTADKLHRSYGSVNEDLQVADWLRSHPKIAEMKTMKEVLIYIRAKRTEYRLRRNS